MTEYVPVYMNKWISVKNGLPEIKGYYLVCYYDSYFDSYGIDIVYFRGKTVWAKNNKYITHWMSLPEPPKESDTK